MRIGIMVWVAAAMLLGGCARNYVITLNNGSRIGSQGKPHLKNGYYIFKDAAGRPSYVPAGRVVEVAPASMASDSGAAFNAAPQK